MPKVKKPQADKRAGKLVWRGSLQGILILKPSNVAQIFEARLDARSGSLHAVVGGDTFKPEAADVAYFHEKMVEVAKSLGIRSDKVHTDAAQF